ncbi:NADPH oxidase organizer 1a [Boleophthalmus pectinirostris]|uniref:NADPH oxidase organizer 1a n=1 Tax=Boleophthalmus pectinirostris TaxID=150288 RepID=UPI00242B07F3|nr:NADPH oxidase organizer 1a [Boleophthalmus pectinirostris]XP_055021375.1 NADPH oxidase organizer 1a [Boleophthalmus pectinirostris]
MDPQTYPISLRLTGVMHKEKKKMYLVSVLWSDQNEIVVYRTFKDFEKLHKQMKKVFPATKLKKSERIIPKFRYKRVECRGQKTPTKSLVRLKFLQKYCNELLRCDPRVCQCTDLVQFFHPNKQDLQPEFSSNSVMVMPLNDNLKADLGGGNVTKPFVTETYRCVAAYETKDTKNKPFKVAADENIDVLIKDKAGWWLIENDEKQMAWFPAPYLEKLEADSEDEIDGSTQKGLLYTAIKSYKATKDDEITVIIGAVVEVLQKPENGWWFVRYKEKAGYIPSIYLQPYNYPHIQLTPSLPARQNSLNLEVPSLGQHPQFSHSQGNLLEMPSSRPSSPHLLQPESKKKSRSLNILPASSPAPLAVVPASNVTNGSVHRHPPPTITIEMDDDDEGGRSINIYSQGSFDSESDFSFSDDLSCSSGSSSLNLSSTEDGPSFRHTPPPPNSNHLSPSTGARMMSSVSDPNLYKGPTSPKVPPRPRPQQILTRCTTITRKNAAKGSNTHSGIASS